MRVRLGPRRFAIRYTSPDSDDYDTTWGTQGDDGIELHPEQDPSMMASTLMHEIVHALWSVNCLPDRLGEEDVCRRLEGPLLALIVDNPGLIRALRKAVRKGVPLPITETAE